MKTQKNVKKKTARKNRKSQRNSVKTVTLTMADFPAECRKSLNADCVNVTAQSTFAAFIVLLISLGNTVAFLIESLSGKGSWLENATDDQVKSLRKRITNIVGALTDDQKKEIVTEASTNTEKVQSEEALGIAQKSKHKIARTALIAGQEILALTIVKWLRVKSDLVTGDQFAKLPAVNKKDKLDKIVVKAFKHVYKWGTKFVTLNEENEKLLVNVDPTDAKAAKQIASAGLVLGHSYRMMGAGNKAPANAYRKFMVDLQDKLAADKKQAKLEDSAKKHLIKLIKDKVGKVKAFAVLKAVRDAAKKLAKKEIALTGTQENRIDQLIDHAKVLADVAKGRGKSTILRAAIPTLKS